MSLANQWLTSLAVATEEGVVRATDLVPETRCMVFPNARMWTEHIQVNPFSEKKAVGTGFLVLIHYIQTPCNGLHTLVWAEPALSFPEQQCSRRSRVYDITCTAVGDAQLFSVPDIKATSDTTQFRRLIIIRCDSKMKLCQSEGCVNSCITDASWLACLDCGLLS
jgi:hypothetical protein